MSSPSPRSLFLLIDIDNTLYDFASTGFHLEMREAIYRYVCNHVGLTRDEAARLSQHYLHSYGLSLYGYVKDYHVDATAYSDAVHCCSYDKLTHNADLVAMLSRLQYDSASRPTRHHLYYCTNANHRHARTIVRALGLQPVFTRARLTAPANGAAATSCDVDSKHDDDDNNNNKNNNTQRDRNDDDDNDDGEVVWCGFSYEDQWRLTAPDVANKPMRAAYAAVFAAIDDDIARDEQTLQRECPTSPCSPVVSHKRRHLQPRNMVMVDDSLVNLVAPLELGWCAVWHAHGADTPADTNDATRTTKTTKANTAVTAAQQERLAKEPFASAYASGRLQVIQHILDLEQAVHTLSRLPSNDDDDDNSTS